MNLSQPVGKSCISDRFCSGVQGSWTCAGVRPGPWYKPWECPPVVHMTKTMVVMTTVPPDGASRIIEHVLTRRLAACVNEFAVDSHYWWQGSVCHEPEKLLIMKSTSERLCALIEGVRAVHPYEVPEIIALPVTSGLKDYLSWVGRETFVPVTPSR